MSNGPLKVHHLRPAPGSHTAKTRVGRGDGSKGKTAGRGTKGTKARYQVPAGFEGRSMVCRRLGMGDLLDRMPAGLFQPVGETGWQLSHGERSRLFMARALLQGADLVVLDESFAELDPESLRHCLSEAADLSGTLLVVAHA